MVIPVGRAVQSFGKHLFGEAVEQTPDQLARILKGRVTRAVPSKVKPSSLKNFIPEGTDIVKATGEARANRTEFVEKAAKVGDKKLSDSLVSKKTNINPLEGQKKGYNLSDADKGAAAVAGDMPREVGGTNLVEGKTPTGRPTKTFVPEIPDMSYQELHHELMKALYSNYVDKAWKLIDDPLNPANEADIVNLNYLAKKYGFGFGDWGVVSYPRIAHQKAHDVLKAMKIQPTGQGLKDAIAAIGEFKNIDDLMEGFEKSLNEIAVPMRRQMDLHNRAYGQFAEVDRINVIRFKKQKDIQKSKLLMLMQGALTAEGVEFPAKGVDGKTLLQLYIDSGLKPTKEMLDLDESIKAFRGKAKELESRMKKSLDPMIKKDIELDIDLMSRIIEDQGQTPVDIPARELQLMRDSYNQQAKPTYVYNE